MVTGSNGNLGQHIIKTKAFEFFPVNRDNWNLIHSGQYDLAFHCAYDLKRSFLDDPEEVLESNIISTAKILRACKDKKIKKLIFISSCAVYGDLSNTIESKSALPVTINGYTKLFNEKMIESFCSENKIEYIILRVFNSYGGDDHFSVIQKLISCAKTKSPFSLINNGEAARDFVHIEDVAKAVTQLAQMDCSNEIINIGTGHPIKIAEILKVVQEEFGPVPIQHKSKKEESLFSMANLEKFRTYLPDFKFQNVLDYLRSL